jgi:hypothetical protein
MQDDDLSRRLSNSPVPPQQPQQGIPAPPPKANEPGEFTKMFAAPTRPPAQQGYNPNAANYADKLYAMPQPPMGGMPPAPQPPAAPPPGGSEFTRAMQRVSFGEMQAQQPPPKQNPVPQEPPPPKSSGRLPVVLVVVGVLVVLAIVLVLMISLSGI